MEYFKPVVHNSEQFYENKSTEKATLQTAWRHTDELEVIGIFKIFDINLSNFQHATQKHLSVEYNFIFLLRFSEFNLIVSAIRYVFVY